MDSLRTGWYVRFLDYQLLFLTMLGSSVSGHGRYFAYTEKQAIPYPFPRFFGGLTKSIIFILGASGVGILCQRRVAINNIICRLSMQNLSCIGCDVLWRWNILFLMDGAI